MPKKKPFPAAPPSQRAEQTQLLPPGGAREPLGLHYFVVLAAREFPRRNGKVAPCMVPEYALQRRGQERAVERLARSGGLAKATSSACCIIA